MDNTESTIDNASQTAIVVRDNGMSGNSESIADNVSQIVIAAREKGAAFDYRKSGIFKKNQGKIESLKSKLGSRLVDALTDPRTIEIMLNPDGVLWWERMGEPMQKLHELGDEQALVAMGLIAGCFDISFNPEHPILECSLPLDGSRFEGVMPPIVSAPIFSIRKKAVAVFTLDDYVAQGILSEKYAKIIRTAIKLRKNILVLGGTGTGKTTFANAVLHEITLLDPHSRQITIEDTYELQPTCENKVALCTAPAVGCDATILLKSTLRLRPDRIIVGELRDGVAHDLLQAWNTGHPGGVTTVHADNCVSALRRVVNLVSQNKNAPREMEPDVAIAINLLVCMQKNSALQFGREINEIRFVDGWTRETGFITRHADEVADWDDPEIQLTKII